MASLLIVHYSNCRGDHDDNVINDEIEMERVKLSCSCLLWIRGGDVAGCSTVFLCLCTTMPVRCRLGSDWVSMDAHMTNRWRILIVETHAWHRGIDVRVGSAEVATMGCRHLCLLGRLPGQVFGTITAMWAARRRRTQESVRPRACTSYH